MPATIYALAANNQILRFDSATPGTVTPLAVSGLAAGQTLQGIDFRPADGLLYGVSVATGSSANATPSVYTINLTTFSATLLGTSAALPLAGDFESGIDFNPRVDLIRYTNGIGENARLNPATGALSTDDTDLTFTSPAMGPVIGAAYDRNIPDQAATTLYVIDRGSNMLATLGGIDGAPSPNLGAVTVVGTLGVVLFPTNDGGFDILNSTDNGGLGTAYAALTASDGVTRLYTIDLATGSATPVGAIGNGTMDILGLAATNVAPPSPPPPPPPSSVPVPASVIVIGSGAGAQGDVRVLDAITGALKTAVNNPFPGFLGGVRVAAGDVTGDGNPDVIVSAISPGAQGHVKVFDGVSGAEISSFFSFVSFSGTVNVGAGDVNGDGFVDILVSADGVTGGHVKAFSGNPTDIQPGGVPAELYSFFAYLGFTGNVTVAGGDVDNDGFDDIVTAANNGHVKVFSGQNGKEIHSFFAFDGFTSGAVNVAAGDVNGDGFADIVVGAGGGAVGGHVKAFSGADLNPLASFLALPGYSGGAFVGLADANADGILHIYVTPGVDTIEARAAAQAFEDAVRAAAVANKGVGNNVINLANADRARAAQQKAKDAAAAFDAAPLSFALVRAFDLSGNVILGPLTAFDNFKGGATIAGAQLSTVS